MTDDGKKVITTSLYQAPCGTLLVGACDERICLCDWQSVPAHAAVINRSLQRRMHAVYEEGMTAVLERAMRQLDEYFHRGRRSFDVPLTLSGTEFQIHVWNNLLTLPYGTTLSYAEQARRAGCPRAVRAVAAANGMNPLSVFIPCHRVIGSHHRLTGYGGGLPIKKFLLELEAGI